MTAMQQQFKVQRDVVVIDGDGGSSTVPKYTTLTAGVHYTAPVDPTRAFFRITNTWHGGQGRPDAIQFGNEDVRTFMHWVSDATTLQSYVTFARGGLGTVGIITASAWELIEYVGAPNGADALIVRAQGVAQCTDGNTSVTIPAFGVGDPNRCAVIITGQGGNIQTPLSLQRCLFTASLIWSAPFSGTVQASFTRSDSTDDAYVSYAVVEFKGTNWRDVQRVERSTAATTVLSAVGDLLIGDDVTPTTPLLDPTKAFFIDVQSRSDQSALDDWGDALYIVPELHPSDVPDASATLTTNEEYLRYGAASTAGTRLTVGWLVESISPNLDAHHFAHALTVDGDTTDRFPQRLHLPTPALRSLEETMLGGFCAPISEGSTPTPYGIDVRLRPTTDFDGFLTAGIAAQFDLGDAREATGVIGVPLTQAGSPTFYPAGGGITKLGGYDNGSYVLFGNSSTLSCTDAESNGAFDFGTGDFAVSIWARRNNVPGAPAGLFSKLNAGIGISLRILADNTIRLQVGGTLLTSTETFTELLFWHHLFAVRNNGVATLFMDGRPIAYTTAAGDVDNTGDFKFGLGSGQTMVGSVDRAVFYNSSAAFLGQYDGRVARAAQFLYSTPPAGHILEIARNRQGEPAFLYGSVIELPQTAASVTSYAGQGAGVDHEAVTTDPLFYRADPVDS